MAQNFVEDGVTLAVPAGAKIYAGTPITITGGYAWPVVNTTGIDGVAMNTCAATADDTNYIGTTCVYRTEGVFTFAPDTGVTLAVGDVVYVNQVDNVTAAVANEQVGARTKIANDDGAASGLKGIGRVVALGGGKGATNAPSTYGQVLIQTRDRSNLADAT